MSNKMAFTAILVSSLVTSSLFAQTGVHNYAYLKDDQSTPKFYVGSALDAAIFSTATIHHDAVVYDPSGSSVPATNTMGTIRFTYFVNIGCTFNFNVSKHVGIFTGVDLKNIGYIEQDNGTTLKRRSYNIGAPIGLKIGNMSMKGSYAFVGGGLDFPINFNEKIFKERDNKTRFNEWWSDRTPKVMPYVAAGAVFQHGISVKVQYYPNNFLNADFKDQNGMKPYAGTDVHLILFSIGFGMHSMHMSMGHKHKCCEDDHCHKVRDYNSPAM
jgi:hypothetical protein